MLKIQILAAAAAVCLLVPPAEGLVLSNSNSTVITPSNSVSCNDGTIQHLNEYYRTFDFAQFGVTQDFSISAVSFGVQSSTSISGNNTITIEIFSGTDVTTLGTPLATQDYTLADQNGTIVMENLAALAPYADGGFTVGILTPNGAANSWFFYMGSNPLGQTAPSYIRAPDCGITTPVSVANVGFPNMDLVMSVTGSAVPEPGSTAAVMGGVAGLAGLVAARRRRG